MGVGRGRGGGGSVKDRYKAKLISLSKLTAVRQPAARPGFHPHRSIKLNHAGPTCMSEQWAVKDATCR